MQSNIQRETTVYTKSIMGFSATKKYKADLARRQRIGWQLVSCTETGKDFFGYTQLTAIYERVVQPGQPGYMAYPAVQPTQPQGPAMNVHGIPQLLSLLSPQERIQFEGELQHTVDRWLALKSQRPGGTQ